MYKEEEIKNHKGTKKNKEFFVPLWSSSRRLFKQFFGYILAAVCLVWVLHDIELDRFLDNLTTINWWWVALAVGFDISSFICQGLRWRLLLRPVGDISLIRSTQAIYVGLFTNEILPMRIGELVRAYLVSRWVSARMASIIPSVVIERLFDALWLAAGVGLTVIFVPMPRELAEAGDLFGIIVLIASAFFIYFIFRKQDTIVEETVEESAEWRPLHSAKTFIRNLIISFRKIGRSRSFYMAFSVSLLILFLQTLAFWLIMVAYGLHLSFWIGAVVFFIIHLGTALPNAPANVGTYQFFCVVGLSLFGIDKTTATGFSLVVFLLLTLPLWSLGLLALSQSGTTLHKIRNEIRR